MDKSTDKVKNKYKGICLYSYYILGEIKYVDYIHHRRIKRGSRAEIKYRQPYTML
ncbi:hypothetical protein [Clostridium sp. Marseille-Q7071]